MLALCLLPAGPFDTAPTSAEASAGGQDLDDLAVGRRLIEDLTNGQMEEADRSAVSSLLGDAEVRNLFEEALGDERIPSSRRLDLADALPWESVRDRVLEIANGEAEPQDRLRASEMLVRNGDRRGVQAAQGVLENLPTSELENSEIRQSLDVLARNGVTEARSLLEGAMEDESLSSETRMAAADSVRRLEGASREDEFLESLAVAHPTGPATSGRVAEAEKVREAGREPKMLMASHELRTGARSGRKESASAGEDSTLERNLVILSIVIILGAALVIPRRVFS